jgi:hypothetical protein
MVPSLKAISSSVSRSSSFVLIGFVSATLIIFGIGRIFNHGRFIHMNIEISLLCAHICLLPDAGEDEVRDVTVFNYIQLIEGSWLLQLFGNWAILNICLLYSYIGVL